MGCSAPLAQEQNTLQSGAGNGTLFGQLTPMIVRTPVPTVLVQSQSTTKIEPVLVTTERTVSGSGSVLLDDTCSLAIREYKEYPFSDLGYEFLYEGDRFQVSIRSDKPVIVYVVNYMDAIRIQASDNTPHYETGITRLQWGNVAPVFFWERVNQRTGTFVIRDVGRYSFIVDPRWMTYDDDWKKTRPFTFRLRITKL